MEKRKPSMGSNEYMHFIMKVKGKLKESRERKQKTLLKHLNSLKKHVVVSTCIYMIVLEYFQSTSPILSPLSSLTNVK